MLAAEVSEVAKVKLEVGAKQVMKHRRLSSQELILYTERDNEYFNYLPGLHHLLDKLVSFFFFQENIRTFQLRTLRYYHGAPNSHKINYG